ncbi:MAG: hypothetical protein U0744_01485 [Gemmataceae bacterium]
MDDLDRFASYSCMIGSPACGEEKVLVFCRKWPNASLYAALPEGQAERADRTAASADEFPATFSSIFRWYRYAADHAVGGKWRMPECDLVLSSSHCVAKEREAAGGRAAHVCLYATTPMGPLACGSRYAAGSEVKGWLVRSHARRLHDWDRRTADHVTHFVANSKIVQARIQGVLWPIERCDPIRPWTSITTRQERPHPGCTT